MRTPYLLSLGFSLALLSLGCSKTTEVQPSAKPDSFEEQFQAMLPILDEHHVMQVKYTTNPSSGNITPVFYFMPREEGVSGSRQIVCSGTGALAFGRCCDAWLDKNPGKCLKVWKDRDTYYADDNCKM